ncbi:hypothetical protein ACFLUK_03015 [Chloroflexota bacterium]
MDIELQSRKILGREVVEELKADEEGRVTVTLEPDVGEVFDEFMKCGWTDGLPIVPPTEQRVSAMLQHCSRSPSEVLGAYPPLDAEMTVELAAINAVMAGCAPEYFPVVLAAVEAALEPAFNLREATVTTVSTWPMIIVNGPVVKQLSINHGWGILGSGFRPNVTIGRTLTLCGATVGGLRPGITENKPISTPMRHGLCIAEDDEASGLLPLHVEQGFKREDSVVTLIEVSSPCDFRFPEATTGATGVGWLSAIARPLAEIIATIGAGPEIGREGSKQLLMIPPFVARRLVEDGWTKNDIKHFLHENARISRHEINRRRYHATTSKDISEGFFKLRYTSPLVPRWVRAMIMEPDHTILNEFIPLWREPEDLAVIVGGARDVTCMGAIFPGHDHNQQIVCKKVEI